MSRLLKLFLMLLFYRKGAEGVHCYQCYFERNEACEYKTCVHGMFGCVKIITYNGGIDSTGMQSEAREYQVTTVKDCVWYPFTGRDGCAEQFMVGGVRVVTCYCNTDYCNRASTSASCLLTLSAGALLLLHSFFLVT